MTKKISWSKVWGDDQLLTLEMPFTLFKFPTLFGKKQSSYELDRSVSLWNILTFIMLSPLVCRSWSPCSLTWTARPRWSSHTLNLPSPPSDTTGRDWLPTVQWQHLHLHIQLLILLLWPSSILRQYQANPRVLKIQTCHASFTSNISIY